MKFITKKSSGFTLIELLIVMVIMSMLAGFATVNFLGYRQRARDVQRKSDIKVIQSAFETFRADLGRYPTSGEYTEVSCKNAFSKSNTVYIDSLPCDPSSNTRYNYTVIPSGCDVSSNICLSYTLDVCLENSNDNGFDVIDDITNCTSSGKMYKVKSP